MDPSFLGIPGSVDGFQLRNQTVSALSERNLNGPGFEILHHLDEERMKGPLFEDSFGGVQFQSLPTGPSTPNLTSTPSLSVVEDNLNEDLDFSDAVMRYINEMLMEEDMEDKTYMLQESLDLQAKEKSFYEALGKKYPPSPEPNSFSVPQKLSGDSPDEYFSGEQCNVTGTSSSNGGSDAADPIWFYSPADCDANPPVQCLPAYMTPYPSVGLSTDVSNVVNGVLDPPCNPHEIESIWNFNKGVEDAKKFLPNCYGMLNASVNGLLSPEPTEEINLGIVKKEIKQKGDFSLTMPRGKKNPPNENTDLEERSCKQAAVYMESTVRSEEFDIVLLHSMGKGKKVLADYREKLKNGKSKTVHQNGQLKGSRVGKARGKKQNAKMKVIDLRTLLIHCAQAVAADDYRSANELLKQIKEHSSTVGDGNQRLARCFADGLEARMAGTGSQIYKSLVNKRTSAADFLKAYHLYLASCPFEKMSIFAANKTIRIKSENAMRVHVIDFGILYGFQWPTFIQRIAEREGGPPMLRITGIEFPQPGFRPAERLEETGHRLLEYAKMFNVPFDYNAVAKKWETIKLEDLKIEKGEFVVVNCIYRSRNLPDETLAVESSRTIVRNLIRNINPDIFIHGIVNGAHGAPFFVTRFREALFHFSSLFDMLETVVPRETPERTLIEKEIFGREALNVIACEGWERVERPETYKQWQVRNLRAGFRQIPVEREIMKMAIEKVTSSYHKDFVIDEESRWLLLGWKGRTIYALSCWTPV